MAGTIDISVKLLVTNGDDHIAVVGEGNYLIIEFPNQKALDRLTGGTSSGLSGGGPMKTLNIVNDLVRAVNMIVDVRVNGKTYVEFGKGSSARITASAIFGKIGSFFGR
ncbi:hypothetical protein [Pontibacter vulgaris]|uniref:hypothetical protein n=1 Tax=Pontibacter vulgaris TaxID=2905679 RepID=UPI001FA7E5C0|nr:hypothetical protein [Pontibacter vulgaris]